MFNLFKNYYYNNKTYKNQNKSNIGLRNYYYRFRIYFIYQREM